MKDLLEFDKLLKPYTNRFRTERRETLIIECKSSHVTDVIKLLKGHGFDHFDTDADPRTDNVVITIHRYPDMTYVKESS